MSNHSKIDDLQSDGLHPLSEQEETLITGGADAAKPGRCKDDEYMDPNTGRCVKKNGSPTPTAS